jgi:hypothetical protein
MGFLKSRIFISKPTIVAELKKSINEEIPAIPEQITRQVMDNTSQQDFVPRTVYCVSNVIFHAEFKYVIKLFPSPTVFIQWPFLYY